MIVFTMTLSLRCPHAFLTDIQGVMHVEYAMETMKHARIVVASLMVVERKIYVEIVKNLLMQLSTKAVEQSWELFNHS